MRWKRKVQADQGFRRWSGSIWEINWEVVLAMFDCTFLSSIALWCGFWSTFSWTLPLALMYCMSLLSVLFLYCYALSYNGLDKEHTYERSVQKGSDVTMVLTDRHKKNIYLGSWTKKRGGWHAFLIYCQLTALPKSISEKNLYQGSFSKSTSSGLKSSVYRNMATRKGGQRKRERERERGSFRIQRKWD